MKRNIIKSKSAVSTMLVAVVVVIIVIAAVAGAYYYSTTQSGAKPSPSPSPTASPSASTSPSSSSSPSVSPSASSSATPVPSYQPVTNFKAGAYANYNLTSYTNGVAEVSSFNMAVGENTTNGVAVWVLTTTAGNDTSYVVISENVNKANASQILGNVTMKMYVNGALFFEDSFDPTTTSTGSGTGTEEINPQTIVGYETVTVPAGTFQNCAKATFSSTSPTSEPQTSTIWVSSNVPAFGMVKTVTTINNGLSSEMVLISYGGFP